MKLIFNKNLTLLLTLIITGGMLLSIVTADSKDEVKAGVLTIENPTQKNGVFAAFVGNQSNGIITSAVINTPAPFNAVGFSWEETAPSDFHLYVRFEKESWSSWQEVELEDDFPDYIGQKENVSRLTFSPYTNILQYRIELGENTTAENIKNLKINYIDSTKGPSATYSIATVNNGLKIISRAQWGVNEKYNFDESGNEIWPKEYFTPKRFIIHHTASSDVKDPAASVRAIHYFHSKGQDWGDIGYNYLIDADGNIYEGRAGGDAVVGGHAYMNNRNSIGIAILGCFHPADKNCNKPNQLTPATQDSLDKLIAVKSQLFGIDPAGSNKTADGKKILNIVGHKDVDHTNCPGDNIYPSLSIFRSESVLALSTLPELPSYTTGAELASISQSKIEVPEGSTKQVIVKFKNTGKAIWRGYDDNYLLISENAKKLGLIDGLRFAATSNSSVQGYRLKEGNVLPGEIGTFILELPAQTKTYKFTLAWQDKGYYPNTDFTVSTVKVAAVNNSVNTFVPIYKATVLETSIPSQQPANVSTQSMISFLNKGNVVWKKDKLKLKVTLETGIQSPLFEKVEFQVNSDVNPGEVATFNLNVLASPTAQSIWHLVKLNYDTQNLMQFTQIIQITSAYSSVITEQNFPTAVKYNVRPTVKLKLRNNGSENWVNPQLKSTDEDGTLSWFYDSTWEAKKIIKTVKKTVKPGEEIEFTFRLKPYWKAATYPHLYKLWTGNQAILINGMESILQKTRVDR